MDNVLLHDALVVAGWLVTLGGVVAVSGRAGRARRRVHGAVIALLGLVVAATAIGAWHESLWGHAAALVLLVLGGGSYAASSEGHP